MKRQRAHLISIEPVTGGHEQDGGHNAQHQSTLQQAPDDRGGGKQRLGHRAGRAVHDAILFAFRLKHQRTYRVDDHFQKRDMHRAEQQRHAKGQRDQRQTRDGHMHRQDERHRLAQVVINPPPQTHSGDDRAEIIIQQHNGCGFARNIRAAPPHRHTDIGSLQRRRVIHPVTRHRDNRPLGLQSLDNPQFLFGHDARKHTCSLQGCGQIGV